MSWLITPQLKSVDGVPVGTPYGGGYVAGFISHTANGVPTHALVVAPRATGATGTDYTVTTMLQWKTAATSTINATSDFDGVVNTAAMVTAGIANHPAAEFCVNLNIGGFADWYLPSRFELDIAYFNLKPSTASNSTSWGVNNYSVPLRTLNNTATYPAQTNLTAFNTISEGFVADSHWSSTQAGSIDGYRVSFGGGTQGFVNKTSGLRLRAFRRITL
jgi:hypothetical protein